MALRAIWRFMDWDVTHNILYGPKRAWCFAKHPGRSPAKKDRKPSNKQVDCTVSTQATALFRATIFFQKESKLLFYQLTKVYSYEHQPPSHWFILGRFLYFEFHPVQCLSSNYQLKIFTAHIPCAFRKGLVNYTILWMTDRSINCHLARSAMHYLLYYTQYMQIYQTTCFCYCISKTKNGYANKNK